MALPQISLRLLLEAGVHFGHQTHNWNPKMKPFIFGARNNVHIIDLAQTVPMMHQALVAVSDTVAGGGRILFVGTKRQASEAISEAAARCAQYYVNHRWLGGTLTNWKTISHSIRRLRALEELFEGDTRGLTKKELLGLTREKQKLDRALGGIREMGGIPDMLFVIDTNKEAIAIAEAKKLGIPVAAIIDSNCDPAGITYPIPGNDDAGRAITLFCDLIARAAIDGIARGQAGAGVDLGAAVEPMSEEALAEDAEDVSEVATESAELQAEAEPAAGETEPETPQADQPEAEAETAEAEAEAAEADAQAEGPTEKEAEGEPKAKPAPQKTKEPKSAAKTDDESAGFTPLKAPKGDADDLKQIDGVGPVLEKKLNEYGIYHFWQIVAFSPEDIAKIDEDLNFKGRIDRDDWIKQAKALQEGS